MKCLILAAGRGTRLVSGGSPKPLVPLLGLTLIERAIFTAKKSGITDFYIVTGYNGDKIRTYLNNLNKNGKINVSYLTNSEWKKGNGTSVLKAKNIIKENFILLMCDHIFDETILPKLQKEKIKNNEGILAVDYNTETNKLVDTDDATKVNVDDNGYILDIGKNIEKYNAYDTGIFLCTTTIFDAIEESIAINGDSSLSGGVKILAEKRKAKTFDIKGKTWIDVDNDHALKNAEKFLIDTLKKPSDGPVSRHLNRPLSTRISKQLLKTPVTPNIISFTSFIVSIIGTLLFFSGGYLNLAVGGVLVQLSSILDGCDGEIARLKFKGTAFGGWLDAVLDRYADAIALFGLTYYVYLTSGNLGLFIGFIAIIGSFMNSYTADKYDGFMQKKLGSERSYLRLGRDVRMFIIFVGAIINQPLLALLVIAALMNLENVRRIWILYEDR